MKLRSRLHHPHLLLGHVATVLRAAGQGSVGFLDSVSDTRILLRYGLNVELRSEANTAIDDIEDMEDMEERGK